MNRFRLWPRRSRTTVTEYHPGARRSFGVGFRVANLTVDAVRAGFRVVQAGTRTAQVFRFRKAGNNERL